MLALYGLNSLCLLILFFRNFRQRPREEWIHSDEPTVLIQLPVFNERDVVGRLVEAVGRVDWPRDRLRIQLLDDSTDDGRDLGRRAIEALRARGLDARHILRSDRHGFKAGALANGLAVDARDPRGPSRHVAIFDADFIPPAHFLRRAVAPLERDDSLAFVQGRWEHLNSNRNAITRAQAMGMDGHFAIEQAARAWSGLPLNFNGTCGIWRLSAIEDAGGWQGDTLTEDLDLSYRAHLRGWRGEYLLDLPVPGEIPGTIEAWRSQQFRWAKGSLQTARKLLPQVLSSNWSLFSKLAALAHMTHYLIHPLIMLSLLLAPLALPRLATHPLLLLLGLGCLLCGMLPPLALYVSSQWVLRRPWRHWLGLPVLTAMGTGIAISNTAAALDVFRDRQREFLRTPKQGDGPGSYSTDRPGGLPEILTGLWGSAVLLATAIGEARWMAPIMFLYVIGFLLHGLTLLAHRVRELLDERTSLATSVGLALAGAVGVSGMSILIWNDSSWREKPGLFALGALLLGAACLSAMNLVQRGAGPGALLWILALSFLLMIAATGITPSDDLNRYVTEGLQVNHRQNPYTVTPADPTLADFVPEALLAHVNHPDMAAIYPPISIGLHALFARWSPTVQAFRWAVVAGSALLLLLTLYLLIQHKRNPAGLVAVAWNPIFLIFLCGEGHNDVWMALLVAGAVLAAGARRPNCAWACLGLAVAAKPFALALTPIFAMRLHRRGAIWMILLATLPWIPFATAGQGLFRSLLSFGQDKHFHGALYPLLCKTTTWLSPGLDPAPPVRMILMLFLAVGSLELWRRRGGARLPTLCLRQFALLLLCLPTLHPWYFVALLPLLPFARGQALPLWTAMAGVYWLHGEAMLASGSPWSETPWVTALAHFPAMALMLWESLGPAREIPEPLFRESVHV